MKRRLVIAVMAVIAGTAGLTACGGPTPPSCAKNQDGLSLTAQNECLTKVDNWCQKNYPNDTVCSNRVFGYAPGKPGDSN